MRDLLKLVLIIAAVFASTFILLRVTGVLTADQIEGWLSAATELSTFYVGVIVILLLFADLFVAVPTLTIVILSGYFLGHLYGALFSFIGMLSAGCAGYVISLYFGEAFLNLLIKDKNKQNEVRDIFNKHGVVAILLSRATPILPEVTACLAGITRMPLWKFLLAWIFVSAPYVLIASYAGSVSSLENPQPAILTAIGLSVFFWGMWYLFHRRFKSKS